MVELPKTEQELDALIQERVKAREDELTSKHNGEMASLRTKHDAEIKKVKDQASLSVEEKARLLAEEKEQETQKELNDLRAFKKGKILEERLAKEGLPSYFKNDTRLLSAEDEQLDTAIKSVKKEYEDTLPKGNTHSSVVQTHSNPTVSKQDETQEVYNKAGDVLKNIIGG